MKCCICGKKLEGYGNNPYGALKLDNTPIRWNSEDRCCDQCNMEFVIPGRIQTYVNANKKRNLRK